MIIVSQDGMTVVTTDGVACVKVVVDPVHVNGYKGEDGTWFLDDGAAYKVVAYTDGGQHTLGEYTESEQTIGILEHLAEAWETDGIFRMPDDDGDWE